MKELTIILNPLTMEDRPYQAIVMDITVKKDATEKDILIELLNNLNHVIVGETILEDDHGMDT